MKMKTQVSLLTSALVILASPVYADVVHGDDVVVEGSVCSSSADVCANGENFVLAGYILENKLHDGWPSIGFVDNTAGEADWLIGVDDNISATPNESIYFLNAETNTVPFIIENGTATNLMYLDAAERIGINTSAPAYTLDIVGNRMRLVNGTRRIDVRADGTDTDINSIGADLYLRSVTAGKNIVINPFANDGLVGVGTATPSQTLDVRGNSSFNLQVTHSSAVAGTRAMVRVLNKGASLFRFDNTNTNNRWLFGGGNADGVLIQKIGVSGNRMFLDANGDMTIAGTLTENSSRAVKTDFSPVDTGDILERVARLPVSRWAYKGKPDMPHLGPMAEDFHELFGVGPDDGISSLDGSGVALAAVKGLYERLVALEADKAQLEAELTELRALVASQGE